MRLYGALCNVSIVFCCCTDGLVKDTKHVGQTSSRHYTYSYMHIHKQCSHCAMLSTDAWFKRIVLQHAQCVFDVRCFLRFSCRTHKPPRIKFPSGLNSGYLGRRPDCYALYPSLPPRQPHLNVHENSLSKNRTPLLSFAPPCSTYNDPVKFRTSAPSSLRRSGPTGRRQLSFTTISSKTTFRSQRPPRHHYDDPAPPDAQVPLRCPGRAQTLPFAFSVGRRCAACCDSATGPAPRRHQKAC